MNKLAQTAVLVSQGMSFLYGGEELWRTKRGIDNSYQSPDSINIIPWENSTLQADLLGYYRQMIAIRRAHKGFRLGSADMVKQHVSFPKTDNEHLIVYQINDLKDIDTAKSLIVVLNGGDKAQQVEIPEGDYILLAFNGEADANGLSELHESHALVAPYSATILAEK